VIAGIIVTFTRAPLHLPGHKALLWMIPILAARLVTRARIGATVGAAATIVTTILLDGHLAGGVAMMPLVVLCGLVFDAAIIVSDRFHNGLPARILLLAAAGMAGDAFCFVKRLFEPGVDFSSDLLTAGAWYAIFGLIAGLVGAAVGYCLKEFKSPRPHN